MKLKTWQAVVIIVAVLETVFLIWAGFLVRKALIIDNLNSEIEARNRNPYIYSKMETSKVVIEQWQKLEKRKFVGTFKNEDKKQTILVSGPKGKAAGRDVHGECKHYVEENGKKTVSKSSGLMGAVIENPLLYNAGGIEGTIRYAYDVKLDTKKVDGKVCYVITTYPRKNETLDFPGVRLDEIPKKVKMYYEKETCLLIKCEEEYDSGIETITYEYAFDVADDSVFQELEGYEEVKK